MWVLEKDLFKFLGCTPNRGIWGGIFSYMSVCEICLANRWYQLQDQSGMNCEVISACRVDSYPSESNLGVNYSVWVFMSFAWSKPMGKLEQTQRGCHVSGVTEL